MTQPVYPGLDGTSADGFHIGGPTGPQVRRNGLGIELRDPTGAVFVTGSGANPVDPEDFVTLDYFNTNVPPASLGSYELTFGDELVTVQLGGAVSARIITPSYGSGQAADAADLTVRPNVLFTGPETGIAEQMTISFDLSAPIPATDTVGVYISVNGGLSMLVISLNDLAAGSHSFTATADPELVAEGDLLAVFVEALVGVGIHTLEFFRAAVRIRNT